MTTYTKFKEYVWLVNAIYQVQAIKLSEINERWLQMEMSEGILISSSPQLQHLLNETISYL